MEAVIEQALGIVEEARRNGGLASLFVTVFPALLLLEVPLNLLVLLGVLRWFLRKPYELPPDNAYRPRVSCIITCYSEGLDVQTTLRSLCEQTYLGDIEMIPVVDGAAVNKTTMQAVRDFRLDRVLYPRRLLRPIAKWQRGGRVSSLNAGLAHCTGEIVMSLDGDTSFDNDMVVNIVRHFADPNVPAVAGSLRVRNWKASLTTAMQALEYLLSIHMAKIGLSEWNLVNNVSGAFGAFRRSFLDKIGGWDTHTAEDLDITLRIKNYFGRQPLRIPFEPCAIGHTDAPTTFRQFLMQRLRWDGDLYFLYIRKHRHSFNPRLLGWPNFLMILISGFFFQLVLPFIIFGYLVVGALTIPWVSFLVLGLLVYLVYLLMTLLMYLAMLAMVSERPRQDLRLLPIVFLFPLFMLVMRCWSAVAMLNEALRRGHEESSMAPWWVLKKAKRF
ncbi:Poly-beta-1,6-N-acetyl-D-glucosamine synthase [Pseudomonas oleovorans subsp. oleovorans]|uniref:Glycosyl transferase family 2 n=1 Tax=Ectopseudomonas oleovorans TaxID=301 RepID=A0A379JQF4_ECTOL|nr:glycosyltransferase [Pseudomonas oleovorans]WGL64852.1 glycosyltransferase [Pseudomonas sp. CW003PS]OWK47605.1 Poly-beta-1,6-N-acetyl-D-glucosamine synthase [Pseudomonas oleovorans subsp. oleovorans]PZQ43110.1 MAG: glycosyltransferase family 2 protein [Pseudomonas oleovorans]SEI72465.1 Glycosyltransferase, catalytic subunit of cellulose synthase and poly-beta-1,6-N-acetylglucosamine synthase [Pseudomonas oleovorans]SUD50889.1 glycosyl transferase family 2 [Pseudomonas oleovorans]